MANVWKSFTRLPVGLVPDEMLLLTDGSVFVHDADGADWYQLRPDSVGDYLSGTWSGPFSMANTREYFASGVLRDGRVFVIGGERSNDGGDTPKAEIFDPVANPPGWSPIAKPAQFDWINGDAVSCILEDGRVLLGALIDNRTAIWDPVTDTWIEAGLAFGMSNVPTKVSRTNEETWTLLPDGTVLSVEVFNSPFAEKYVPSLDRWVPASSTPSNLIFSSMSEIGPAVVLPDGRLFAIGATGHTSLYKSGPTPSAQGTWTKGPDTPKDTTTNGFNQANGNIQTAIDAPCCLLPNGTVLFVAGDTVAGLWSSPTRFYIFDPRTNSISILSPQPPSNSNFTWTANLLVLPTGQVLFSSHDNNYPINRIGSISILTVDPAISAPKDAWRPTLTTFPTTMATGHAYLISGTQFNGLSQACSYGDDGQMATNYPIVRLTNTANQAVFYLRSFDFSSMGIATGNIPQTATVQVPMNVQPGRYHMVVIANGIPSSPVTVDVVNKGCFMLVDRGTYGQGEIRSLLNQSGPPAVIDPALYVVVEGFKPSELGLTSTNLANPPIKPSILSPVAGVSFMFSGSVAPENNLLPPVPQRFIFPYKIVFQSDAMFNFPSTMEPLSVIANLTAAGTLVSCSAIIDLVKNPNPFILHGDIAHGYPWWLSTDIRVFQIKANQTKFGAHVANTGAAKNVATSFIQKVLDNLNSNPGSSGPLFDALPQGEDTSSLALAPTDVNGVPVYNFALARVRYRDIIPAKNVRVFFRMWPGAQINAAYNTSTLYRAHTNAAGQKIPLLGVVGQEIVTIPFFASKRVDTTNVSMITQTDAPNNRPAIKPATIGEVDVYYGCWVDINQPNDLIFPSRIVGPNPANLPDGPFVNMGKLLSIQQLVRSQHQCILAEISFDPDPIASNADPSNSDKLAQRNLTFVSVPNPGLTESRRAPQVFEVRPTPKALALSLKLDELMIEWDGLPLGSVANIYMPAVDADEILRLAGEMYPSNLLQKVDQHTVACPTGGFTFIPIPPGSDLNFPALLTVDISPEIEKGQEFAVVVKQITSAFRRRDLPQISTALSGSELGPQGSLDEDPSINVEWRRVLGVFRMTIPVATKEALLAPEERLLSVLLWIGQSIAEDSRWHLVFQRYLEQIAGRVQDMGGDPSQITADPNGNGVPDRNQEVAFGGKICRLVYDREGHFKGFTLRTKNGDRNFHSDERQLESLAERAWARRTKVRVCALKADPEHVVRIELREPACQLEG
ncbi:MAG: hypothetical protein M1839_002795 [Geoglossum umbratile]|nr:MAG: hypothetical protein M1839_002795 [Geoglossum umbratile]